MSKLVQVHAKLSNLTFTTYSSFIFFMYKVFQTNTIKYKNANLYKVLQLREFLAYVFFIKTLLKYT